MRIIAFILVSLMVVSTASAAVMGSITPMPSKITGGQQGFAPRVPGGCHFELGKGVTCMGTGPHKTFNTVRDTSSDECFFDSVKGAVCPGRPLFDNQKVFVSKRREDPLKRMRAAPPRLTVVPPAKISGDFKGPVSRRPVQPQLRVGQY